MLLGKQRAMEFPLNEMKQRQNRLRCRKNNSLPANDPSGSDQIDKTDQNNGEEDHEDDTSMLNKDEDDYEDESDG